MKSRPANSVFELAKRPPPRPPAPPVRKRLVPSQVAIKPGVPIPSLQGCKGAESPYAVLLKWMTAGDMVELCYRHSCGVVSAARRLKVTVARRKLGDDLYGVWRIT